MQAPPCTQVQGARGHTWQVQQPPGSQASGRKPQALKEVGTSFNLELHRRADGAAARASTLGKAPRARPSSIHTSFVVSFSSDTRFDQLPFTLRRVTQEIKWQFYPCQVTGEMEPAGVAEGLPGTTGREQTLWDRGRGRAPPARGGTQITGQSVAGSGWLRNSGFPVLNLCDCRICTCHVRVQTGYPDGAASKHWRPRLHFPGSPTSTS